MTDEDLKLIRQIIVDGGRKYTAGNIDLRKYDQLTSAATNISDVEYLATEKGRATARGE
jgi:hypothetical protein